MSFEIDLGRGIWTDQRYSILIPELEFDFAVPLTKSTFYLECFLMQELELKLTVLAVNQNQTGFALS